MMISLVIVRFKDIFCVYTSPFKTLYDLTKKLLKILNREKIMDRGGEFQFMELIKTLKSITYL